MRFSNCYIPTLREVPSEAELISHRYMLRAGMIRKVSAGIYSYLPLGLMVLHHVERVIREEMQRVGAQEVLLPAVLPAELWKDSGRWDEYGKELLRMKDRHDREFCLGPTHEEAVTALIMNEVRSYKKLPLIFYQIQTKFRDEIRPRFGLMRSREFIMKDAYSFDEDDAAATESYQRMYKSYTRIFERCGFDFRVVEAATGLIGGSLSHEFMVLADSGEDAIVICSSCSYAANMEMATTRRGHEAKGQDPKVELLPLTKVETPGMKTISEVAGFLSIPESGLVKSVVYKTEKGAVVAVIRGDLEINEAKLKAILLVEELELADHDYIKKRVNSEPGYVGPVGLKSDIKIIADLSVKDSHNFVVGGGQDGVHLINCNFGRDFTAPLYDLVAVIEGNPCPACSMPLNIRRGIEVGHVFMLGDKYSKKMKAFFLDKNGAEKPFVMGCYGVGVGRIVAAAVEQHYGKNGMVWPEEISPFDVVILPLNSNNEKALITAELIYDSLMGAGTQVFMDDRQERAGVKFADAELMGVPYQVVIGDKSLSNGYIEFVDRKEGSKTEITVEEIIKFLKFKFNKRRGG